MINSKYSNAGIAITANIILAKMTYPLILKTLLPKSTPPTKTNIKSHNPKFSDEIVLSINPIKKKYNRTKATTASIPQSIQNSFIAFCFK